MRLSEPPVMAPFGGKQRPFLGIVIGITEVFGPDGSFAAPVGFLVVTNELIWLFKGKRFPTPGVYYRYDVKKLTHNMQCLCHENVSLVH